MDDEESFVSMLKFKYKLGLMRDGSKVFEDIAKNMAVYKSCGYRGKKYVSKTLKSFYKDYCKGLKELDKKVPVYIELPKLEEQSNGQYKEVKSFDETESEQTIYVSDLPEQINENKNNVKKLLRMKRD